MRVLDVGCGEGVTTRSLGTAVHPIHVLGLGPDPDELARARRATRHAAVSTAEFLCAEPDRLPLPAACVDVVFCHDLLEHLPRRAAVLREFFRVLRPGGTLSLSTVDWGRAQLRPKTVNVDAALRGRHLVYRRAGGDPFAGKRVVEWVEHAGFRDIRSRVRYHPGGSYRQLAQDIEAYLAAAIQETLQGPEGVWDQQLASAARSARMWARGDSGEFSQCWVETLATR